MKLLAWLRRRWLLATVPEDRRCSFCARPAFMSGTVTEDLTTEADGGPVQIRRTTRYCDVDHRIDAKPGP